MSQDMAMPGNIKQSGTAPRKKTPKKITQKYLYNSGLAYLQRFPTSTGHFKKVMLRKIDKSCRFHIDQDKQQCLTILDGVVQSFENMGLLNDGLYLQGMVNSYRNRGLSEQMIMFKLQQKGLPSHNIKDALILRDDAGRHPDPELLAALVFMRKKRLGAYRTRQVENQQSKEIAAFARNGFSFGIAQKALATTLEEAEEHLHL